MTTILLNLQKVTITMVVNNERIDHEAADEDYSGACMCFKLSVSYIGYLISIDYIS